ncbi:hypothetical protein BDDG_07742 [Blastomyces dermatitidis ATCC 18188]|uniref:Uncharacterized protein n=1 Tax=Ajellomyces dermatitidis (strain ATCC 18188 / CBS 674.68) TaxID=653446 RepID=F2TNI4_AJEDA|nr:hypothetical protein BDDG_07742 [Blastomyces dermatitidis ATCC 18188]
MAFALCLNPHRGKLSPCTAAQIWYDYWWQWTTIHASCRDKHDRSMKPRAWIRTFTSESDLTHKQLDDLFAGRFPTSCADEVIHLTDLPQRDFS